MPMIEENKALVEFLTDAVQNNFKSAQEGRPIFDDKTFIRIQTPGDTKTVIYRVATEQDKQRFPRAYEAFKRGEQVTMEGTPLEQWPQITKSQVRELKHLGILSVESLASVSDANIQRMGPGYMQLKTRAKQFLESASDDAERTAHARHAEQLQEKIELLEAQNKALQEQLVATQEEATAKTRTPAAKATKAAE